MNSRMCLYLGLGCMLCACHSQENYSQLVGDWEVVMIEAAGERLNLEEVLESRRFQFTNRGIFQHGDEETKLEGRWKIVGNQLHLIQPEIRDLNGRVLSRPLQYEWELTLSSEWMIWRGTARNQSQHLKIQLHKIPSPQQAVKHLSAL